MFEMIIASMAGFWLGLYLLVVFGSLIWASETDSFFMGLGVIAIMWALGEWLFGLGILASLIANPLLGIVYVVLYAAIGAVYTRIWKLPNFVKSNEDRIQYEYTQWADSRTRETDRRQRRKLDDVISTVKWTSTSDDESPKNDASASTVDVSFDTFLKSDSYSYSVRKNKDRVASWVLLWPASITWELSHKPFVWAWEHVYYGLGRVFERANHDMARKILEEKNK